MTDKPIRKVCAPFAYRPPSACSLCHLDDPLRCPYPHIKGAFTVKCPAFLPKPRV